MTSSFSFALLTLLLTGVMTVRYALRARCLGKRAGCRNARLCASRAVRLMQQNET